MAATKTPAKTTPKTEGTKTERNFTAKQVFEVVDGDLPSGKTRQGRTSPYVAALRDIAKDHSGKWVLILTAENSYGATNVRKNLTKRQEAGELPEGTWEFEAKRFDPHSSEHQFPGDSKVQSALYVRHNG